MRYFLLCTIAFILTFIGGLSAQNYDVFKTNQTISYENELLQLFFVKTDNYAVTGLDTTFNFQSKIDTTFAPTADCLAKTTDTVPLGPKLVKRADSTTILFNRNGDSIFIKPNAALGENWRFYTYENGDWIKATYLEPLYGTVFDTVIDSIKRLSLAEFTVDSIFKPLGAWTNEKFDITKNYGISRYFNILNFPNADDTLVYRLAGITEPYLGIVDVDAFTAFNYKLGYEFHYKEVKSPDLLSGSDKKISSFKHFIIGKEQGIESVNYTVERVLIDTLYSGFDFTTSFIWDTIILTINYADFAILDTLEFSLLEDDNYGYSDWDKYDTVLSNVPYKTIYDIFNYNEATDCLSNPDEINQPEQIYGDGIGLVHYMDSSSSDEYYKFDMTYFQKSFITWGTPYDFSDFDYSGIAINEQATVKVYPNPCYDVLYFNLQEVDCVATIFNVTGEMVMQTQVNAGQLNVTSLEPGLYYLKINGLNNVALTQFVKM